MKRAWPHRPDVEQLYVEHHAQLHRIASWIVQDASLGEDLVAEGFIKLIQHWDRVQRYDQPALWVRRVVIRDAVRTRDRRAREVVGIGPSPDRASLTDLPGTSPDGALHAAIGRLPRRMRAVVVVHYFLDLSIDRTAELLGMQPGTVKAHLNHARAALGAQLGDQPLEV